MGSDTRGKNNPYIPPRIDDGIDQRCPERVEVEVIATINVREGTVHDIVLANADAVVTRLEGILTGEVVAPELLRDAIRGGCRYTVRFHRHVEAGDSVNVEVILG